MFVIPYGAPEGYEWFVTLVVLVCLYFFALRSFMRAHPPSSRKYLKKAKPLDGLLPERPFPSRPQSRSSRPRS